MKRLRPCIVNDKKAFFHMFVQTNKLNLPDVDGNTEVISDLFAIVEYEDGTVEKVSIDSLRFTDRETINSFKFSDVSPMQPTIPEGKQNGPKEEKMKCPYCEDIDNQNAIIYSDMGNKECFVYCPICNIETIDIFRSKKTAIAAFDSGKNKANSTSSKE